MKAKRVFEFERSNDIEKSLDVGVDRSENIGKPRQGSPLWHEVSGTRFKLGSMFYGQWQIGADVYIDGELGSWEIINHNKWDSVEDAEDEIAAYRGYYTGKLEAKEKEEQELYKEEDPTGSLTFGNLFEFERSEDITKTLEIGEHRKDRHIIRVIKEFGHASPLDPKTFADYIYDYYNYPEDYNISDDLRKSIESVYKELPMAMSFVKSSDIYKKYLELFK